MRTKFTDRYLTLGALFALGLFALTGDALAWRKVQPNAFEWNVLPRMCKNKDHAQFVPPPGQRHVALSDSERALKWAVGGWHYCTGVIKLYRAESHTSSVLEPEVLLRDAEEDVNYSYSRIDKNQPWAAEIGVNYARVKRLQNEREEAIKTLDEIRKLHPWYPRTYVAYAQILFDLKDYERAAKILTAGNEATKRRVGAIQYYLGLSLFHNGDIEGARRYEAEARANHYPMQHLSRLIAQHDHAANESDAASPEKH